MQQFFRTIFYDYHSRAFRLTNDFLAFLTLVSIAGVVLETVDGLSVWSPWFRAIEVGTVSFFTLEYIGRIVAAQKKLAYVVSFFGIVDLLAILPTFFGLANLTFLKSVRILRIMRFLRMLMLVKVARNIEGGYDIEHTAYTDHKMSVQIYFMALFSAVLLSATGLWLVERGQDAAENIPIAMLWSAKILLGGTSQAQPETTAGDIIVIVTRFVGLALFGLLINVVGISLRRLLFGSNKTT